MQEEENTHDIKVFSSLPLAKSLSLAVRMMHFLSLSLTQKLMVEPLPGKGYTSLTASQFIYSGFDSFDYFNL